MVRWVPSPRNLRRYLMPQSDLVLFSVHDRVALITVNDPDRRDRGR